MTISNAPASADTGYRGTREIFHHTAILLVGMLPDPIDDTPDGWANRDAAAIAAVAALCPVSSIEAQYAARCVACNAHAAAALRLAVQRGLDPAEVMKRQRIANTMARSADNALRMLQRLQTERRRREAANAIGADFTEQGVTHFMVQAVGCQALGGQAVGAATAVAPAPTQAAPEPTQAAPEPMPETELLDRMPDLPPEPGSAAAALAEAELWAVVHRDRALLIRRHGGVPDDVSFGPPSDDVAHFLVHGQTPILLTLDRSAA